MTMFSRVAFGSTTLAAAVAVLSACGGGGGSGSDEGTLRLALTDAPACGYDAVNVTVERVRIHKSSSATEGASGWEEIVLAEPKRVNLLDLTNGVLEELGSTSLPAGTYTQLRLVLAQNGPAANGNTLANSVIPTGGIETALDTPSAAQSGLKLNVNIDVAADQVADLVLDFDACKSVVTRGNTGRYNLKPVVSVLPRVTTPGLMVQGQLAADLSGASVSLQQDGVPVRATVAMSDDPATTANEAGKFVLSPVPVGTYDLVISAEGRVTAVMTGVPVTETGVTSVTPAGYAIDLAPSVMRTASGTVTTTGSATIPDATVRALQTVDGTKVELLSRPVDADTGAYVFSLAAGTPVKTAYSATATSLTFAPQAAAAGKYALEALVPGKTTQTASIEVANADAQASFSFAP